MITKQPIFTRLPTLLATGILSTGLLLSGCSNNESADTDAATDTNIVDNDTVSDEAVSNETTTQDTAGVVDTADGSTEPQTEMATDGSIDEVVQTEDEAEAAALINNDNTNPITPSTAQDSLVTNPTQAGTPEDTVKQALNSLYAGDVSKAASYYQVDMANFEQELGKTQSMFQQTVDGVTILDTTYNEDKTRATVTGELMLKGQNDPVPSTYELQKIAGQWKILG